MSERLFGIHGAALELRSQRIGVLTANLANASTPGFKARDMDFANALAARTGGASTGRAVESSLRYRIPITASADGNTVDVAEEQMAFAENAVAYSATLSFLQGRADTLKRALKGE